MIYVGIDPGIKGGYAIIRDNGNVSAHAFDSFNFCEDMRSISGHINTHPEAAIAIIEQVSSMPGQGVKSMFSFGKSAGYLQGVLDALFIPYFIVHPKKWKGEFSLLQKSTKGEPAIPQSELKKRSIACCKSLFPEIALKRGSRCKVDSDGMAEALLIAEYGKRNVEQILQELHGKCEKTSRKPKKKAKKRQKAQ